MTDVADLCGRLRASHSKIMNEAAYALEREVDNWKRRNRAALVAEDMALLQTEARLRAEAQLADANRELEILRRAIRSNLVTEDDGTGDIIYPGQTGAEAVYPRYQVSKCDDGQWMVHTEGDVIAYPGQGNEAEKAKSICAALNRVTP